MTFTYQQHIDGAWTDAASGGTWDVINPATEEVVRDVPFGGARGLRALRSMPRARAFPVWRPRTAYERGAILQRAAALMRERADELARTTVREAGKPFAQARGEWLVAPICSTGSPRRASASTATRFRRASRRSG